MIHVYTLFLSLPHRMEDISISTLSKGLGNGLPIQNVMFQNIKAGEWARVAQDQNGFRTLRLIRLHILKYIHNMLMMFIMILQYVYIYLEDISLSLYQTRISLQSKVEDSLHPFLSYKLGYWWWFAFTAAHQIIPIIKYMLWRTFGCYELPTHKDFPNVLQLLAKVPESIMLILQVTPFEAVVGDANGPPAIPQPYLDADKTIVVPSNKDVQEVFALRNEWLTQEKTHMAAERVRVLNQMALFIVWSWALKYVGSITIYENDGLCWNNGNIAQCKERIRNFLRNEFNFFFFSNVSKSIPNTLPKVTIIDCITGETYLNFDDTDLNIQGSSLCSRDELLQECTFNELKVYLQDERIRLKHIGIDEQPLLNWYSFLPPFPKLTIVPTTEFLTGGPLTTCEPGLTETSVTYRRNEQFNFKMFLNVLSYYNRSQGKESSISIEEGSHRYSTSYN